MLKKISEEISEEFLPTPNKEYIKIRKIILAYNCSLCVEVWKSHPLLEIFSNMFPSVELDINRTSCDLNTVVRYSMLCDKTPYKLICCVFREDFLKR